MSLLESPRNLEISMTITELSPRFAVAPQIGPADVREIADRGFRSIICNRPDGESPDQPDVATIRAEAEACGLRFAFLPVETTGITGENVGELRRELDDLPAPVLAYCRSGTRSRNLWMMANG